MTVNEKIKNALEPFGLPITADFFGGDAEEYFTFNYADDRSEDFGDDEPLHVVAYMQIHYFSPMERDYLSMKREVRKALFKAGFTYPEVTDATIISDRIRHLVFECSIENEDELSDEEG